MEWEHIQRVLIDCGGNVSQTAKQLGLHRRSLQRKPAKYPPARKPIPALLRRLGASLCRTKPRRNYLRIKRCLHLTAQGGAHTNRNVPFDRSDVEPSAWPCRAGALCVAGGRCGVEPATLLSGNGKHHCAMRMAMPQLSARPGPGVSHGHGALPLSSGTDSRFSSCPLSGSIGGDVRCDSVASGRRPAVRCLRSDLQEPQPPEARPALPCRTADHRLVIPGNCGGMTRAVVSPRPAPYFTWEQFLSTTAFSRRCRIEASTSSFSVLSALLLLTAICLGQSAANQESIHIPRQS